MSKITISNLTLREYRSGDIVKLKPETLIFLDLIDKPYELVRVSGDRWGIYRLADNISLYNIRCIDILELISENDLSIDDMVQINIKDHKLQDIQTCRGNSSKPINGSIGKIISISNSEPDVPIKVKFEFGERKMFRTNLQPVFRK